MAAAAGQARAARAERLGVAAPPLAQPARAVPSTTPTLAKPPMAGLANKPAARAGAATGHGAWQVSGSPGQALVIMPGQMHVGTQVASVRTLLGSCVAIILWHPERLIGGMCHFLLPTRTRAAGDSLDGRYGDEAVEAMVSTLRTLGADPAQFHAHLYGGADTMPEGTNLKFNVGERNIEMGWSLIDRHGFQLQGVDVGEDVPRTVTLTLASGEVDMRRGSGRAPTFN